MKRKEESKMKKRKKKGRNDERTAKRKGVDVGGDGTRLLDKRRGSCLLPRVCMCDKKHNCVILG